MRIGLNLLYLIPGIVGGTEVYAVSLIRSLADIDRRNEYVVFLNQESATLALSQAANLARVICPFRATRRLVRYGWEQTILPGQLRRYGIDVAHSLGYVGPLFAPCPHVVTVHDLNFVALGDMMSPVKRNALQFFCTQAARRSAHVITDSSFSKAEITSVLRVAPDKVTVIYPGPGQLESMPTSASWDSVRAEYDLPESYIAAFSSRGSHKNISRLVAAFGIACKDLPHHLVLIGHLPPGEDGIPAAWDKDQAGRVRSLGYVPAAYIAPILEHADLFAFPSLYEGFGLPVLEAQQIGVPVVCSTAGSLPEVAGQGALFFDPFSVDQMAQAIGKCLSDRELCANLQRLGRENVARFSWETTARATLALYERMYEGKSG